uniref:Putative HNH homing endonuclease n=1 Tax=Xylochloris irregularis TaxID=480381 RepID=A0A097KMF9_9CHLO|nr:putative HNH homing endonuclease [Xylochloris irregularis]AIT94376.1 putative HNH homing endonuclease [Xylochloris irregularis]
MYHYRCALTGKTESLVCHHLNSWNTYPEQRFEISNGVLLARSVHADFHITYKFGNNIEKQFEDFCRSNYKIDWLRLKKNTLKNFMKKTQYGNHQPTSSKSFYCGEKVQRLGDEKLNQ